MCKYHGLYMLVCLEGEGVGVKEGRYMMYNGCGCGERYTHTRFLYLLGVHRVGQDKGGV